MCTHIRFRAITFADLLIGKRVRNGRVVMRLNDPTPPFDVRAATRVMDRNDRLGRGAPPSHTSSPMPQSGTVQYNLKWGARAPTADPPQRDNE